jgi:hypothetical protein
MRENHSKLYDTAQGQRKQSRLVKTPAKKSTRRVSWNEWNPFERATGEALRQLNRRQPKPTNDVEEALL